MPLGGYKGGRQSVTEKGLPDLGALSVGSLSHPLQVSMPGASLRTGSPHGGGVIAASWSALTLPVPCFSVPSPAPSISEGSGCYHTVMFSGLRQSSPRNGHILREL